MDMLNFNKEQTIVFEGHCLPDVPLSGPLLEHHRAGAAITQIARELDMTVKPAVQIKNLTYGIYGYADLCP